MKRVWVDVDTQFDFCDPAGALFVQGGPSAAEVSASLVRYAVAHHEPIVGSVDSHHHESWEFNTNDNRGPEGEKPGFPPHCVKGTRGWLKIENTLAPRFVFVPIDASAPMIPAHTQAIYFEKEVYSLFANPHAATVLEQLVPQGADIEFVVFGVATDYCVRAAALGLLSWAAGRINPSRATVLLVEDAIAGVAPESTRAALTEMEHAGVKFVSSHTLLAG